MTRTRSSNSTFTGARRERKPRRAVRVIDKLARIVISIGGIGSIAAVSLVGVFLVFVAAPLFRSPTRNESHVLPILTSTNAVELHPDEYGTMSWSWDAHDGFLVRDLHSGRILEHHDGGLPADIRLASFARNTDDAVFATGDGRLVMGRVSFDLEYLLPGELPESLKTLPNGKPTPFRRGLLTRIEEDTWQYRYLAVETGDALPLSEHPLTHLVHAGPASARIIAAMDSTGTVFLSEARQRRNLLTGQVTTRLESSQFQLDISTYGAPLRLMLNGRGDNLYMIWSDGRLQRYDTQQVTSPELIETGDLMPQSGIELASLIFMVGDTSLVVGDSTGETTIWFLVNKTDAPTADKRTFVAAKHIPAPESGSAVTSLAASHRSRLLAIGYADGTSSLYHVTNERLLMTFTGDGTPVATLSISPRDDGLLATSGKGLFYTRFEAPHPEAGLKALLAPLWYEGYDQPAHVWQSTGGSDDFEAKYGLMPLIAGTLKATFYSLLFGLPLALMAALTTSEFMNPRIKMRVKPAIEMMASLPSVVLGFLAALVFAPWLENWVPQALAAVLTVPFSLFLGAHLWQLLPVDTAMQHQAWKLPAMGLMLLGGLLGAVPGGDLMEAVLFAGEIKTWLNGNSGSGLGGWLFLVLPVSALLVGYLMIRHVEPCLRQVSRHWSRRRFVLVDLLRFLGGSVAIIVLSLMAANVLAGLGMDPRGSMVGTYVQRNALVVGFVMGFAIIPIVYTIAEDALSSVPDHLRAASLGAGASPWQTAVRIVVPPAMSGLFSAMMVGLGRAVGETMIVLMAAGNTPVMDMNIFNGFRTLSANIAVELPEAVQNSTHFRILFLAALTLFIMTFIINTLAEIVRMRFRKKATQL